MVSGYLHVDVAVVTVEALSYDVCMAVVWSLVVVACSGWV